jgi:hypothetical protein
LAKHSDIVPAGPVLDDLTVGHPPNVNVGPRHVGTHRLDTRQQRHSRRPMLTADGHVVRDKIALGDEVVILDREVTAKIGPDGLDDLLPTLSTLTTGTGGVIHHVFGDQLVDCGLIA